MDPAHPAIESGLVPLAVGFAATGLIRLIGGPGRGACLACASISLGLLVSVVLVMGWPTWVPGTALSKLPWVVGGGLVLGIFVDAARLGSKWQLVLAVAWLAVTCAWLAWPLLHQPRTAWQLAGIAVAGLLVLMRMSGAGDRSLNGAVSLLVASVGLAGVTFASGSLVIAQLAGALAAATGGFALWNWPRVRYSFGAGGIVGGGVSWMTLATLALLLTDAVPFALAPLVLVFFADALSRRIPAGGARLRPVVAPILQVLVAALPVAAALLLAHLSGVDDSAYYQ